MVVQSRAGELGSFFQRRVNFLISVIGTLSTSLEGASHTVDIETEVVPFMIDSESDKTTTAIAAVSDGVWSLEHGIAHCFSYDELQNELQQIGEEQKKKAQQQTKPTEPKERQL